MAILRKLMHTVKNKLLRRAFVSQRLPFYRLRPEGKVRGRMLLSLGTQVYERILKGEPLEIGHIAPWQNLNIASTFLQLGFIVDVMNWNDRDSRPEGNYDVLIDAAANLERLSKYVGKNCIKILHPMFAHWVINNANAYSRHADLLRRRGVGLMPRRLIPPSNSAEMADHIILSGGPFGNETYSYSPARIHHIPPFSPFGIDEFLNRDMETCRRRFVWLGGAGCLHKGLDLTIEVLKDFPDCELYACGRISDEPDFEKLYRLELYASPNIKTVGWVDTTSDEWRNIANRCAAIILPSASEFGCGSVICAMRNGLIPIITDETSIDLAQIGQPIEASLKSLKQAVCSFCEQKPNELSNLSRAVYDAAHKRYSRKLFLDAYRKTICQILDMQPLESWASWKTHLPKLCIEKIRLP